MADKDKQLKIMTDQNSELLRLLETEEGQTAKLEKEGGGLRSELEGMRHKYSSLLTTAKTHEEMAAKAAREGQLRAEELRLLQRAAYWHPSARVLPAPPPEAASQALLSLHEALAASPP